MVYPHQDFWNPLALPGFSKSSSFRVRTQRMFLFEEKKLKKKKKNQVLPKVQLISEWLFGFKFSKKINEKFWWISAIEPGNWLNWKNKSLIDINLMTGHALGFWICGCGLFYKRVLWTSKSAGAHSTKSLKICGCKRCTRCTRANPFPEM